MKSLIALIGVVLGVSAALAIRHQRTRVRGPESVTLTRTAHTPQPTPATGSKS